MPHRNLHIQRTATVPQIFCHQHRRLFANHECGAVGVAADVIGTDTQVGALEPLNAVYVEALVEDAMFDDAITVTRGHGAGAET